MITTEKEPEVLSMEKTLKEKIQAIPMTYYIVAINIIVFLLLHLTNFVIEPDWLVSKFSKMTYAIATEHEYYRLFSAIFVHESITHIAFNCIALILLGRPIEFLFGKTKFLIIFLTAGLFGSLFSFVFSPYAAIGASGGVFGVFGVHLYLFIKNKDTYMKAFGKDILQLLVINVVIGFILPNIDYWGHFGGIFGGFMAATTMKLNRKFSFNLHLIIGSILTSFIFFGSFIFFSTEYNDYVVLVDELIVQANNAIDNNDITELQRINEQLVEEKPLLPPLPGADTIVDNINNIINNSN